MDHEKKLTELYQAVADGIIERETFLSEVNQLIAGAAAKMEGSGAIAQGNGAMAGGKESIFARRDVIIVADSDDLWRRIRNKPTPESLKKATQDYLQHLVDMNWHLDFRGMGVSDRTPLRMSLLDMYVPLKARIELPQGETWERNLRLAGRRIVQEEAEHGGRLSKPVPILDLLKENEGLIVLGDPGAGKTTLLKYLALQSAADNKNALGLGDRFPFLLPLSAYANTLADRDVSLTEFIGAYYTRKGLEFHLDEVLREALDRGAALVLLDGIDEVQDIKRRQLVIGRVVEFFTHEKKSGNKFILTSRIVGYREIRPNQPGLAECTLTDFENEEIGLFINKWTSALEYQARGYTTVAEQEAQREKAELIEVVHQSRGVRNLASNPLLLTILALMKRQGIALPERRVELYEKYVETLVRHWNLARSLDSRFILETDMVETMRILAPLALYIHKISPGVGLVRYTKLLEKLRSIFQDRELPDPEVSAERFLKDIRENTGIIVERGQHEYGFIHLTFQEYLAAVAVCREGQQDIERVVEILSGHAGDDHWHEVIRLAVCYIGIIQGREEAADNVVIGLAESVSKKPGLNAAIAGEAAADAWPGGISSGCRKRMQEILLHTMWDDQNVRPRERVAIGNALSRLGDPRFRKDFYFLPNDKMLGFIEILNGPFLMGSDFSKYQSGYQNEMPKHEINLPTYFIAKYPVTTAQFQSFVEDSGYEFGAKENIHGYANHPIGNVTWYDANAYCQWLTNKMRIAERTPPILAHLIQNENWEVRLPSEAEWEKAARGNDSRIYPWGNKIEANRCNFELTGIMQTSAVGCFPSGVSPYGCLDMSGNVYEWTRSQYGDAKTYIKYPYVPDDGREDMSTNGNIGRVMRGGAWGLPEGFMRCALRIGAFPYFRVIIFGFRVVLSPK